MSPAPDGTHDRAPEQSTDQPADQRPDDDFEVELTRHDGIDVVTARGTLDIASAVRLRHVLIDPLLCSQPVVVVDLNSVTFLDSTGIGTLVAGRRATQDRGARFVVVCDDGQALRTLKIVRLHLVMQIWPSLDVVLGELRRARAQGVAPES
jgi:anti-sigma B factor antagonist